MTQAICFECKKILEGVGKPMEELIRDRLPLFCGIECSTDFPDNSIPEFNTRLKQLEEYIK